jgi:hypothetical protein
MSVLTHEIRFLFCQRSRLNLLFGPGNHRQNWKSWERSVKKLINDTFTISDTSKNQPKRLDSDNQINVSRLIVYLAVNTRHLRLFLAYLHEIYFIQLKSIFFSCSPTSKIRTFRSTFRTSGRQASEEEEGGKKNEMRSAHFFQLQTINVIQHKKSVT